MTPPAAEDAALAVEAVLNGRWPEHRIAPSLDRIGALCELLGDPQRAYAVIHLAGTNGKTSTARMVDALLTELGLRTGRSTSPHLESVTERICVDGLPLSPEQFAAAYEDVAPYLPIVDAAQEHPLSYFEVVTAMAFGAFADAPVAVAVLETGMGGAWDASNVADATVAAISTVDLDHQDYLGEELAAIATEKAGIIKAGSVVVLAEQDPRVEEVLLGRAATLGAPVRREGVDFGVLERAVAVGGQVVALQGLAATYGEVFLPLHGRHQARNAALALAAVEAFVGAGAQALDGDVVQAAFASVTSPGRLEVVRRSPTIVVDAAHNPSGARASAQAVSEAFAFDHLVGVIAALSDKDVAGILWACEPVLDEVVITQNASPRCLLADDLATVAVEVFGADRVVVEPDLSRALELAVERADSGEVLGGAGVLVTGSVVTAGEARRLLRGS